MKILANQKSHTGKDEPVKLIGFANHSGVCFLRLQMPGKNIHIGQHVCIENDYPSIVTNVGVNGVNECDTAQRIHPHQNKIETDWFPTGIRF